MSREIVHGISWNTLPTRLLTLRISSHPPKQNAQVVRLRIVPIMQRGPRTQLQNLSNTRDLKANSQRKCNKLTLKSIDFFIMLIYSCTPITVIQLYNTCYIGEWPNASVQYNLRLTAAKSLTAALPVSRLRGLSITALDTHAIFKVNSSPKAKLDASCVHYTPCRQSWCKLLKLKKVDLIL